MATQEQYDFFCVLDFEATCDEGNRMRRNEMEIIEFPSVLIDGTTCEKIAQFQCFVTPTLHAVSEFCTSLTGITQTKVDEEGKDFQDVLALHQEWLASHGIPRKSVIFVTCGDWDLKTMLPQQCKRLGISVPAVYKKWINIKKPFSYRTNAPPAGMDKMLKVLKLKLEGRHHSGIDDCNNIAQILVTLINKSTPMKATGNTETGKYQDMSDTSGYGQTKSKRRR